MNVAPGFRVHREGAQLLVVDAALEPALRALGLFEPDGAWRWLARGGGGRGRARNALAPLPGGAGRLHLRPVRRGGWLGPALGGWIAGPGRPVAEVAAHARLHAAGAPVPRPVLAAARRERRGVWKAAIGTLHLEDTRDGLAFLASGPGRDQRVAAACAAGKALRRFHDAGGRHADLHVGNLVVGEVAGGEPRVWIVDLDRARVAPDVPPRRRAREIARLERSLAKRGHAATCGDAVRAAFFAGYTAGDGPLARALLGALARERRRGALHRAGYRLR